MAKSAKKVVTKKRRSNKRPSSFSGRAKTTPKLTRRVATYSLNLTRKSALVISARKFKTSKAKRSAKTKQIVLPLYGLPFREIAIKPVKNKSKKQSKKPRKNLLTKTYTITLRLQPVRLFAYSLIILGLAGTTFFGLQMRQSNTPIAVTNFTIPTPVPKTDFSKPKVLDPSRPLSIKISKIGLDVKAMQVGRLTDGSMETPPVLERVVGWYKYSPTPGELGPAVIAGHVDSYTGPSVFWRLHELKIGDFVEITRADKTVAKFRIDSVQNFEQDKFPTNAVYGNIDHAGLRLITCGGIFNRDIEQYTHNTVVFASLVNGNPQS